MKDQILKPILGALLLAIAGVMNAAAMHDDGACVANASTLQQLRAAQQATARFNSIGAAEKAGYSNINLPVPNMGDHWVNGDLIFDGVFDPARPEALVYNDLGNGQLQLVAVEYLAPYVAGAPPEGFVGTCDQWSPFTPPGGQEPVFWTLHAWIWQSNISGTFAKFNPLVP